MFIEALKDRGRATNREALFDGLIRSSYRPAFGFACRLAGDRAEAEDLVQETFLRAYRFFHRYDESLSFTSWIYRIMANAHIDMVRRRGKIRTTSLDHGADGDRWEVADHASSPDRAMMLGAMGEPIQKALDAMTPEFRTAVLLADVEGLAYEEVAEIMETSVGTVRSRIHRGRRQLREFLALHYPDASGSQTDDL